MNLNYLNQQTGHYNMAAYDPRQHTNSYSPPPTDGPQGFFSPKPTFHTHLGGSGLAPIYSENGALNIDMDEIWADLSRDDVHDHHHQRQAEPTSPSSSEAASTFFDDVSLFDDLIDNFNYIGCSTRGHNISEVGSSESDNSRDNVNYVPIFGPPHQRGVAPYRSSSLHDYHSDSSTSTASTGGINPPLSQPRSGGSPTRQLAGRGIASRNVQTPSTSPEKLPRPASNFLNSSNRSIYVPSSPQKLQSVPSFSYSHAPPSPAPSNRSVASTGSSPRKRKSKSDDLSLPLSYPGPSSPNSRAPPSPGAWGVRDVTAAGQSSSGRKTRKIHAMLADLVGLLKELKNNDVRIKDLANACDAENAGNASASKCEEVSDGEKESAAMAILSALFGEDVKPAAFDKICSSKVRFAFPTSFMQTLGYLSAPSTGLQLPFTTQGVAQCTQLGASVRQTIASLFEAPVSLVISPDTRPGRSLLRGVTGFCMPFKLQVISKANLAVEVFGMLKCAESDVNCPGLVSDAKVAIDAYDFARQCADSQKMLKTMSLADIVSGVAAVDKSVTS